LSVRYDRNAPGDSDSFGGFSSVTDVGNVDVVGDVEGTGVFDGFANFGDADGNTTAASAIGTGRNRAKPFDPRDGRNYAPYSSGTARFPVPTNSRDIIVNAVVDLFEEYVDRKRAVHNLMLNFNGVEPEGNGQLSLFAEPETELEERSRQEAILDVKRKFGKNALLKGIDLMPQATQRDRNRQLGGHKSGE
jgi:hypothetical protein